MKPIKCKERKEIFEVNGQGQKQWIQDWNTYLYLGYKKVEDEVDIIILEDLRAYPVGDTKKVTTVTQIVKGKDPDKLFYPDEPEENHSTSKLYKMLYVCPWRGDRYGWLDEIQEVGFNVVHSWFPSKAPWEKANDDILDELERRGMYGCVQMPKDFGDDVLRDAAKKLAKHSNGFASPFEEPDGKPHPNKEEQYHICDVIKQAAPELQIWMCLNWGDWKLKISFYGVNLVMTDSYGYDRNAGSIPVQGTMAAVHGDPSLPWWTFASIMYKKFEMMKEVLPANMPVINIQQGYISEWSSVKEQKALPNIEEEWNIYHARMGLNSFSVYPHGQGQEKPNYESCVMSNERIKNQCKELMKKLK